MNGVVITVKDYKEIRQMYLSCISQGEIARQLQISRNTVSKYCKGCAVPWERKVPKRETTMIAALVDRLTFHSNKANSDKIRKMGKKTTINKNCPKRKQKRGNDR